MICNSLEQKTASRLDLMETNGATEGLLWIEITEEKLYEEMLHLYSLKTIRETLRLLEAASIIQSAKGGWGKAKQILFNYEAVNQLVISGSSVDLLTGKITGHDIRRDRKYFPENDEISEKLPVTTGDYNNKEITIDYRPADSFFSEPENSPEPDNQIGAERPTFRAAKTIHDNHPPARRDCGVLLVEEKLIKILKYRKVRTAAREKYLDELVQRHRSWCKSSDWVKESSKYAVRLSKWLAKTELRYEEITPPETPSVQNRRMIL